MADLWDEESADGFELPGDDAINGLLTAETPSEEPAGDSEALVEREAPDAGDAQEAPQEPVSEGAVLSEDDEKLQRVREKLGDIPDTAARSYMELETELGRLRGELGAARQLADERLAGIEQRIQQPQQPLAPVDYEQLIDADPRQAMIVAAQRQDGAAYLRAREEWDALSPGAPALYEQSAAMQRRLDEIAQQVQETREPVVRGEKQAVVANAYRTVSAEFPDFEDLTPVMNRIVSELAESGYDWITPALESGNPQQAEAAWRQLALSARGLQGENLAEAAREAAREHVAETQRARKDAVVASASTTVAPAVKGFAERVGEQWAEIDKPFSDGWNIS